MSDPCANLITTKKGKLMDVMCVYCEGVYGSDTIVCPTCNEYDGMMPLVSAIEYLNLDPNEYN